MILELKPLTISEAKELAGDLDEKKELKDYFKKYNTLNKEKGQELGQKIRDLNNIKIKEEHIIKIVDFLPKRAEELGKIFSDISLDEKETNDILEIVTTY